MNVSDVQRLKALEAENIKLNKIAGQPMLQIAAMRDVLKGEWPPWWRVARSCGSCGDCA